MASVSDGGFLVFVADDRQINRVIVHRAQARSHKDLCTQHLCPTCGSGLAREGDCPFTASLKADHNPDFNRLNARISALLNALPLSFLLYNEALTCADGYVPGSLRIAGSINPSAAVIALA